MEPGDGGLGVPADLAQARAVRPAPSNDLRCDAALAQSAAIEVVVVTAVGTQHPGFAPGAAPLAPHRPKAVDQRQKLGDIVAVATGQRHPQRSAAGIGQHVMLRARPPAANRARTDFRAASPRLACT